MWRAIKRLKRDRQFVPFDLKAHTNLVLPFAKERDALNMHASEFWDLFLPVGGYVPYNSRKYTPYVNEQAQFRAWSRAVLRRDGQCAECGAKTHLQAHHVWRQSFFPNLRYLLRNGITLCDQCHFRVHQPSDSETVGLSQKYLRFKLSQKRFLYLAGDQKLVNAISIGPNRGGWLPQ